MKTIQGPGLFLAQFIDDEPPFDSLDNLASWASELGYVGLQIPTWDRRVFDLERAAASRAWCDEFRGRLAAHGLVPTELSTHLQGQLVAAHPAYDRLLDGFAPAALRGRPKERTAWAKEQIRLALQASANLGLGVMATFSGALAWPFFYPWPQRPAGLVEEAFAELSRRWSPLLDQAEAHGVDLAYEIHPGEDLHDGVTFERFLAAVGDHPRANILFDPSHLVLQGMDAPAFVDLYHERIRAFHVKDAEFEPDGRSGAYGGYQGWTDRPGRFRSLGDGSVEWTKIFTRLAKHDYPGWAVVEWECAFKDAMTGATEGAEFVRRHIIPVTRKAFDDFAGGTDAAANRRILGVD